MLFLPARRNQPQQTVSFASLQFFLPCAPDIRGRDAGPSPSACSAYCGPCYVGRGVHDLLCLLHMLSHPLNLASAEHLARPRPAFPVMPSGYSMAIRFSIRHAVACMESQRGDGFSHPGPEVIAQALSPMLNEDSRAFLSLRSHCVSQAEFPPSLLFPPTPQCLFEESLFRIISEAEFRSPARN